uniref:Uncharacterized protein n=1 Tax=Anguilla anguilla TaxID=7936 RepID=A0A0E9R0L3_ANGAN
MTELCVHSLPISGHDSFLGQMASKGISDWMGVFYCFLSADIIAISV